MRLLNRNEGTVRCFAVIFVLVLFTDLLVIVYLQSRSRISRSVDLRLANNAVEFLKLVNASYGPVRIL
ncbi:hypothetical protein OESDEN_07927 [Oesophagostomum dentatum]|uniref:Uncharacterized protein n=1 Tax=Oesophagostomum dentatum TaxID=61180 RepID=A0A0B1T7U7_OESDE|nr:hypothetical protein OESDEN_07927 [Oesophagostomum dentatum]